MADALESIPALRIDRLTNVRGICTYSILLNHLDKSVLFGEIPIFDFMIWATPTSPCHIPSEACPLSLAFPAVIAGLKWLLWFTLYADAKLRVGITFRVIAVVAISYMPIGNW